MKKKRILITLSVLLLAIIIVFIIIIIKRVDYNKLEAQMTESVEKYFNEQIKGKVSGVNRHKISLENLNNQKYNVEDVIKHCDLSSFAYIVISNPNETDIDKILYTTENHLLCGDYQTMNK